MKTYHNRKRPKSYIHDWVRSHDRLHWFLLIINFFRIKNNLGYIYTQILNTGSGPNIIQVRCPKEGQNRCVN